ncbi:glycosyltransferase family 1 protein [Collimonas sp.]|jgi:glycosyltransferase involved in cell wall biosynthesis|uniref:glycosyltransferase family 4 protein n=1 Tax=Collimonas sp. TaxID=1963772 RepID=UPI002CBBEA00|nr:glycosyltransferase family 1 protein [Collimonas sp.]HWW08046.1 glycosyltransferase family 1 protein [Collimonas sp.]
MKLTIALNSRILLAPRTGIGNYVAELAQALQQDPDLGMHFFYGSRWRDALASVPMPGYSRWAGIAKRLPAAYSLRRIFEQKYFNRGVHKLRPDVYHEPSLWPLDFDGPTVMTVHDLTHIHYPQTQPKDRLKEIERRLPSALTRVSRILVDSEFIGHEIKQHFGLPAQKVVVAPLACSAIFQPRLEQQLAVRLNKLGLNYRGFILSVGTLEPRKNLLLTLRAHARLPPLLRTRFPLLVVGMPGWQTEQLSGELSQAVSSGHVRVAGYLDQADLACVTAAAKIMVFPSLYEGFGLPVLEAMASGTPVIASDRASLPEVAAAAAAYVDPQDETGLTEQMRRLIEDDRAWMARRIAGLERSVQFSWKKCAAITAEVYRQVAAC